MLYLHLVSILLLLLGVNSKKTADLLVYNARIYTVDNRFKVCEAMAIKEGRVIGCGNTADLLARYKAVKQLDAGGKTIVPGLIDAHCHFTGYATDMWKCDLVGTKSFEEVLDRVKRYALTAPMTWIYARGWDQNDWEKKDYPHNEELNRLFPDRPVFLKRIDGHAALVNQVALDLAKISATTAVSGGSIELKNGKPTGLLIDNAMDLVDMIVPVIPDTLAARYYQKAQQVCFSLGLTRCRIWASPRTPPTSWTGSKKPAG